MKFPIPKLSVWIPILACVASIASSAPSTSGSGANYSFRDPPLNSMGVKSLSELRGKPIVIDFWGKR